MNRTEIRDSQIRALLNPAAKLYAGRKEKGPMVSWATLSSGWTVRLSGLPNPIVLRRQKKLCCFHWAGDEGNLIVLSRSCSSKMLLISRMIARRFLGSFSSAAWAQSCFQCTWWVLNNRSWLVLNNMLLSPAILRLRSIPPVGAKGKHFYKLSNPYRVPDLRRRSCDTLRLNNIVPAGVGKAGLWIINLEGPLPGLRAKALDQKACLSTSSRVVSLLFAVGRGG